MDKDFLRANLELKVEILTRIEAATLAANRAILDGMEVSYSRDEDHLYVTLGEQRESLSIPAEDEMGSILMYDPETFESTGLEVPFFMEKLAKVRPKLEFWTMISELINRHGDTLYIPGRHETEKAQQAFRELAMSR